MSWELLLVGLLGTTVWLAIGVMLHHRLADIAEHLARAEQRPATRRRDEDRVWRAVAERVSAQAAATENRVDDIETIVTQLLTRHNELVETVNWVAPLVRQWAEAASGRRR